MGTYINISGHIAYKKENAMAMVEAMKELNKHDEYKRGGTLSKNGYREKWFSWFPPDYDKDMTRVEDIFRFLGFEYDTIVEDDLVSHNFHYNDKWGQHEIFFVAMSPYLYSLDIYHEVDEFELEDRYWSMIMNPNDKNVHILRHRIEVTMDEMSPKNVVLVEDFNVNNY